MKKIIFLFLILIIAFYFRFNNLKWDDNHHLHPDERFLTMVMNDTKIPNNLKDYLDPQKSSFNPANANYKFFVYGIFPLTLTKQYAIKLDKDNYDDLTLLGRRLSAFFDLLIVVLVYKTAHLLIKNISQDQKLITELPLWSAFIYAVSVLPIQLSHFFAVDTFLNFFMFAAFYTALRSLTNPRFIYLSSILFALALASKVTALFILPLILLILVKEQFIKKNWFNALFIIVFYLALAYCALRFANPYMFENASFFDPTPSRLFVNNLRELRNLVNISPQNYFPPMIQWMSKYPIQHSLVNNSVFGFGIASSILLLVGIGWIILNLKLKIIKLLNNETIILIWVLGLLSYQSLQTTPTLRYFIIIYPFISIFAAFGLSAITKSILIKLKNKSLLITTYLLFAIFLLIWPVMFSSIYKSKHTRVQASEWIYQNIKNGAIISNEHWDDGLPLPMSNNYGKQFENLELPVFAPDDENKWQEMNKVLRQSDYYILSSNRGWGSIGAVPEKYPLMSKFYTDLFAGKTEFKKIAEFTSYPAIKFQISNFQFQILLPDDWSDEGFTVYDHPKVMIYAKKN